MESSIQESRNAHKRNRPQLSCTNCRHGKLKCDRNLPCSQCVKRGKTSQCSIPATVSRRKPTASMQTRLKHLESLVKDAMNGQMPATGHLTPETSEMDEDTTPSTSNFTSSTGEKVLGASTGRVVHGSSESTYVGATHWAAILEDIEEVKEYFEEQDDHVDEDTKLNASLVFNAKSPTTTADLFAALPPKHVVDRLVSRYFNSNSPGNHTIHKPTFQKEYRELWDRPESVPVAFLGLVYSIMALGSFAALAAGEEAADTRGSPLEMLKSYRECCVQSLILSNYTKPSLHHIITLLIYIEVEFLRSQEDQVHPYLLIGNAVRLALRMGLHRDATKVGGSISPYQAEIRRRVWYQICQIDLLASFHLGLPGMAAFVDSDTLLPRNLMDEDFNEGSLELPQSRPESDITPLSYMICKSRMCGVVGKMVMLANRLEPPPYAGVLRLDALLKDAYDQVPPFYRLDDTLSLVTYAPARIVTTFSLGILFLKSRCLLHRNFLLDRNATEYTASKEISLQAAKELLRYQAMIYEAAIPGSPLATDPWFFSSLSMHDFLLAAMIIFLHVMATLRKNVGSSVSNIELTEMNILEQSKAIWKETVGMPSEAKKASAVLGAMLQQIYQAAGVDQTPAVEIPIGQGVPAPASIDAFSTLSLNIQKVDNGDSLGVDRMHPSYPSSVRNDSPYVWEAGTEGSSDAAPVDTFENIFDFESGFDWGMFDNQIRPKVPEQSPHPWLDFTSYESQNDNNYDL